MNSALDRQRDIDAEGQRAAIYHDKTLQAMRRELGPKDDPRHTALFELMRQQQALIGALEWHVKDLRSRLEALEFAQDSKGETA